MKVLMVSWEYPPVVIGGLGRHVHHLATALAEAGHEVVVLSRRPFGTDPSTHPSTDEISEGVRVVAAAQDPHEFDFGTDMMAWTLAMGHSMVRAGLALEDPTRRQAVAARRRARARLAGGPSRDRPRRILRRATGFHDPRDRGRPALRLGVRRISRQVHAVESWLVRESDSLITCSASMGDEITELFGPGLAEIAGHPQRHRRGHCGRSRKRTPRSGPARLLYLGRLEYEKGVHDAIAAMPRIRRTHPGTTLTIAGDGTQQDLLLEQARKHKVLKAIDFVGRVDHEQARRAAARHRRRRAAQPLRAVRHRRARGGRDGRAAGHVQRRRPRRGRASTARPACRSRPATSRHWPPRCARCSTIPRRAQRRADRRHGPA